MHEVINSPASTQPAAEVVIVLDRSAATLQTEVYLPQLDATRPPVTTRLLVRCIDIALSVTGVIFAAPVILGLAVIIRSSAGGTAIYRSERISHRGGNFMMLKLRTMGPAADAELGHLLAENQSLAEEYRRSFKMRDDPRITPIGRFLRKTNLDELPQFWNVLRGDMSIVGPRPKLISEAALYGEAIHTVLRVKPGLTGRWQVSGRNDLTFAERIRIDVDYALNRSLKQDIEIVMLTVAQMVRSHSNGAY